eukprot:6140433-Alexandrium_andersonii.AAC.1
MLGVQPKARGQDQAPAEYIRNFTAELRLPRPCEDAKDDRDAKRHSDQQQHEPGRRDMEPAGAPPPWPLQVARAAMGASPSAVGANLPLAHAVEPGAALHRSGMLLGAAETPQRLLGHTASQVKHVSSDSGL